MLKRLKEKQEKIDLTIKNLIEESARGIPILVEGRKDKATLLDLGATGPILTLKTGGKSFNDTLSEIEQTKTSTLILLLDFDRRGKEATKHFKESLERTKTKPDLSFWLDLKVVSRRDIQSIESLSSYIKNLNAKIS